MSSPVPDMQNIDISRQSGLGLGGRLMSNAALLGGSKAIAAVMGIATLIITAKALNNNAAFGTLLFIHTYMLFFSELTSFKTWQAIIRFGSDEVANENPRRLAQLFKTGLITDAAAALIACLIAITSFELYNWLSGLIPNDGKVDIIALPDGWSLKTLIIGYCSVILFRQVDVSIGIFRLFDKFSILAFRALVMPSVRLIGALVVWHQGWGFIGFLAVWYLASFLGYIVLIGFGGFEILKRGLWPLIKSETICRKSNFPELYPFLIKANIDATLKTFKKNFPSLAVMLLLGPVALAVYKIADEISRILSRAISLFDQVLFPELSRMASEVDFKTLKRTTLKTALGIGMAGLFFSGVMLVFGEKIIALAFEDTFADASTLSVMLLIASSLIGIALPFYTVFYVLTRPGVAIWVRLFGVVLFIIILFALAKPYGLYAIGWAAIIAAAVELICVFGLANRFIKLSKKQA